MQQPHSKAAAAVVVGDFFLAVPLFSVAVLFAPPSPRLQPPSTAAGRRTRRLPSAGMRGGAISVPVREFHASATGPLSSISPGHSPAATPVPPVVGIIDGMASPSPVPHPHGAPGAIWALTSTKKDKLNELLTELNANGVATGTSRAVVRLVRRAVRRAASQRHDPSARD